jgi:cell division protein FtsN
MAYEMKELNGSLFRNDKKERGTNQRDYNGSCKINGVDMWISAWLKTSDSGVSYMSLAFEPKQQQAPPQQSQYQNQQPAQQQQQPPQNQQQYGNQAPQQQAPQQQPQQNQPPQQQQNNGGDGGYGIDPNGEIPF